MSTSSPTKVRFLIVGVTALMSVLLYLDRFCISFAEIFIKEDLSLTDQQIAWILSAFFWTYALAQVPSGWLTDLFGARIMLTTYILCWSLFTGLTGLAFGTGFIAFVMLFGLRMGFGLAQAGAYPTGANIISKWVPFTSRGLASSTVAVGGRVGGWMALFITGYLIVMFVPVSVSSQLKPGDLINAARLCHQLKYRQLDDERAEAAGRVDRRVREQFSSDVWPTVSELSRRYEEAVEAERKQREATGRGAETAVAPLESASEEQRKQLREQLNALIKQRDAFSKEDVQDLPLETEAKRLLDRDRNTLSQEEVERLNRLVLEATYPDSLRKVYGAGWRSVMWLYGGLGILVAGLFWLAFRNRPEQHPLVNKAEVEVIESGRPPGAPRPHGKVGAVPLKRLVSSFSMWMVCLSQWCTNVGWVFIVTWAPRYFQSVHDVPVEERALMVSIPPLVGWAGMVMGGWLTDRMVRIVGLRWGRALPMSFSRFTAMAAYIYCLIEPSPWSAVAAFSVVAFSTDLGTGSVWAFKQDVGGRYVGSILGWGNMWGNLGAAITPPLLIWIVNQSRSTNVLAQLSDLLGSSSGPNWNLAFLTCATAFFIAGLACLGVDATKPIAPKDEEDEIANAKSK